ncbi:protein LURP-one-related 15-like [Wolffia australiana]
MSKPNNSSSALPISVVSSEFCSPNHVDIFIQQKFFSGTGKYYTVEDASNKVLFQVKKEIFSLRGRQTLQDASLRPILTMQRKFCTAHSTWKVFRGDGTEDGDLLFIAKRSRVMQLKTTLNVFLAENTCATVPDFKLKGSYCDRSCIIYSGDSSTIVAEMKKHRKLKDMILGKESVTILPNVDQALIVALIILYNEINKEGGS